MSCEVKRERYRESEACRLSRRTLVYLYICNFVLLPDCCYPNTVFSSLGVSVSAFKILNSLLEMGIVARGLSSVNL